MGKNKQLKALRSAFGVLGKKDILPFGRYKGHTIETVLRTNASYVHWLANNTSLVFTPKVQKLAYEGHLKQQADRPRNYGNHWIGTKAHWSFPDYDYDVLDDWGPGEWVDGGNAGFW